MGSPCLFRMPVRHLVMGQLSCTNITRIEDKFSVAPYQNVHIIFEHDEPEKDRNPLHKLGGENTERLFSLTRQEA